MYTRELYFWLNADTYRILNLELSIRVERDVFAKKMKPGICGMGQRLFIRYRITLSCE
jgi:hypothetical protein